MKKNILWIVKMTTIYSLKGFLLQIFILNMLFAYVPVEGQELKDIRITLDAKNVTLESAFKIIEKQSNLKFFYIESEVPVNELVTIEVTNEPLSEILQGLSIQFNLNFQIINNQIVVKRSNYKEVKVARFTGGEVKGRVTDSKTKEPLTFANIIIYKAGEKIVAKGGTTDMNGFFSIDGLTQGNYVLEVKYMGYVTKFEDFTVDDNKKIEINFALDPSLVDLDEVVVTGSFSQREKKELSNPITVISMDMIQQTMPAVTNITDILTYNVPGYYQDVPSELTQGYNQNPILRGLSSSSTKQLQIYIDGVPVTNEAYRSQSDLNVQSVDFTPPITPQQDINKLVNVNDIEKIEVLRGPMASTLYGSGAGGGVINIITKKSSISRTRFNVSGTLSAISDKYSDEVPLKNNLALNLTGGSGQIGYNLGASRTARDYQYLPSSIPQSSNISLFGSSKINLDPVLLDLRIDYGNTESGTQSVSKMWETYKTERNWDDYDSIPKTYSIPRTKIDNQTGNASAIIKHVLMGNWYHSLMLGFNSYFQDRYDYTSPSKVIKTPIPGTPDTLVTEYWMIDNSVMKKNSIRYVNNYYTNVIPELKLDLTGGIEYWRASYDQTRLYTQKAYEGQLSNETIVDPTLARKTRRVDENYGFFAEMLWGYEEFVFLTAGFRIEKNTNISANNGYSEAPRVGLSLIQQFGDFQIKPRVSYGSTIQPPRWEQIEGNLLTTPRILPNDNLQPEKNAGYEIGADFYFQDNYSLEVTYYNQQGTNLIFLQDVGPDQIYNNVGSVDNNGIEIAGSAYLNPFMINFSFSYMDNRYGENFYGDNNTGIPGYQAGDRVVNSPKNIFNASVAYTLPEALSITGLPGSVNLQMQYRGTVITRDLFTYYDALYTEAIPDIPYSSIPLVETGSYMIFSVSANYWVLSNLQFIFDMRNIFDKQLVTGQIYPMVGRETSFGLRLQL